MFHFFVSVFLPHLHPVISTTEVAQAAGFASVVFTRSTRQIRLERAFFLIFSLFFLLGLKHFFFSNFLEHLLQIVEVIPSAVHPKVLGRSRHDFRTTINVAIPRLLGDHSQVLFLLWRVLGVPKLFFTTVILEHLSSLFGLVYFWLESVALNDVYHFILILLHFLYQLIRLINTLRSF